MQMRSALPLIAVALTLGTASVSSAQDASSTQVRPAQAPAGNECDELMRQVQIEMPSAVGLRVPAARKNISEAQDLCNSGQDQEGAALLRGVLNSVHEGG